MDTVKTTMTGTPTRLRSGAWGATVRGTVAVGATVQVTTRAGKTWPAMVTGVVWSGPSRDGSGAVTIVTTTSLDADRPLTQAAPRRSRGGRCHTDGDCSSLCSPRGGECPCADGGWFACC